MKVPVTWILLGAMLLTTCGNGEDSTLVEISKVRQCRANMNTLATDQAMYSLMQGEWAVSVADLDEEAGRLAPLVCPECGGHYDMITAGSTYTISCPSGSHGSVCNGTPSWSEGSPYY